MSTDYRQTQFRRDWWNEKIMWWGGLTRNDLAWVVVGGVLITLFWELPIDWNWVFGRR